MNFFAALTCTIFAWGLAEDSKVFLRNFQSAGVSSHRTRRTHSYDRFGTNIRGCSGLRCTNQADGILQGGAAVSAAPTKQTAFFRGCSCLSCTNKAGGIHVLGWCT